MSILLKTEERTGEDGGRDWMDGATGQGMHEAIRRWKGQEGSSPRALGRWHGLTTPGFWTSGLHDLER